MEKEITSTFLSSYIFSFFLSKTFEKIIVLYSSQSRKIFELIFKSSFLFKITLIGEFFKKLDDLHLRTQLSIFTVFEPTSIASTSDLRLSE